MKKMQRHLCTTIVGLIFCSTIAVGVFYSQPVSPAKPPFTLDELRARFKSQPKGEKRRENYYLKLSQELNERGTNFLLSRQAKEELDSITGYWRHWITPHIANAISEDRLIAIIRELPREELYKVYTENYYWIYRGHIRYALYAASEYLNRYKSDLVDKERIEYLEKQIPRLELRYRETFRID